MNPINFTKEELEDLSNSSVSERALLFRILRRLERMEEKIDRLLDDKIIKKTKTKLK